MVNRFTRMSETLGQYKERRKSEQASAYERKVVKSILVGLGIDRVSLALGKHEVDSDEEDAYLTMSWLAGEHPSFPATLVTREAWTPSIVDFFRVRRRNNSFWSVWNEATECMKGSHKSIGCVFPFPTGMDLGHGIVHNVELPYEGYDSSLDLVYMQRIRADEPTITLELLPSFINRLRVIWEPS